ncbi:acetyl-CoA carboxylase biotin carboxylase subunit [Aquaspirillum serpens]|uniref:acetyl-CoA carboxylase biotin carboxylase subunit n=1 Tax=Aquaspirillum serpens TaxID=190 RepID=UPI0003B42581|nr:acetyl/propionyl/methylcrotonyl-CoA carboxylase subunit alpha [Aquaspirillum serpens]
MFTKILIANRGEIACRVIKTARRMGIRTVAVYSDADRDALFVRLADEAVHIGGAPAAESYLQAERIVEVAKRTGAQAVHPGYGFLSENEGFAEACAREGIVFIGPPVSAIAAMGSKSEAKKLMEAAGVPLVPGYHGDEQAPDFLRQQADQMGYPVLIKASAGGGGKGMRIVEKSEDFIAALESCQREARASFGSDHVLVEKYLQKPRHIEIQVFADTHGNTVYLFERDCSVQRRHQKVLEEAPAPNMGETRRRDMGEAACAAARAVNYVGAGTVEFIVDTTDDRFYFMEMNTRLQVEHPVTEMITGLDLVEWQLRVAAGETLPKQQAELVIHGHAIEARVYAEDPYKGFLPATGTLHTLRPPAESAYVRVDTGVVEGDTITPFYDPMIAKLIVWDENRETALARMERALSEYQVVGLTTNLPFLHRLVTHHAFATADLDTGLIARYQDTLLTPPPAISAEELALLAVAEVLADNPDSRRASWRLNSVAQRSLRFDDLEDADRHWTVQISQQNGQFCVIVDQQRFELSAERQGARLIATLNGHRRQVDVFAQGAQRVLFSATRRVAVNRHNPFAVNAAGVHGDTHLKAPMPGRVVALLAEVGSRVEKGSPLMILEAMKMEHTISAPADGVVQEFYFAAGDQVGDGDDLVDFMAD